MWPGPKYTSLIEKDPQIVKISMDIVEIGGRRSAMPRGDTPQVPGSSGDAPRAPEMSIKHV